MKKTKTSKNIWEIIKKENNFLLITHKNPDGDAVGSILGLYYFLKEKEKEVYLYLPNGIPYVYQFLIVDDLKIFNTYQDINFNIAIFLDCGDIERIGDNNNFFKNIPLIINIDHHPTNTFFGNLNLVNPKASSTTEILANLLFRYKENLTKRVSQCLLTGLITDTGSFRYSNTNSNSFRTAIKLVEKGADISYISQQVYEKKSLPSLYLLGKALFRLKLINDVAFSYITKEDMEETNSKIEDTEGIIDTLRMLKDAKVVIFLYPLSSFKTKISLRSKSSYIDVGLFAKNFGGGGHKEAAGFEKDGEPQNLILKVIEDLLGFIMEYESLYIDK
ncbi:MAG: bifunctional oligoribonuclease/PAP phosphatase NrnA [Dictyoglomaceae bacterium]|nr:bifunctional oligoribonuclease/PAP phosphatase NrnA [Dictyoglomaceae bacterium]